jgi:hypothetical protein
MKGGTRNIETFKVGATRVNEADFHKHQAEMHEHHDNQQGPAPAKVQTKAEQVAEVMKKAHEKVLRRKKRR